MYTTWAIDSSEHMRNMFAPLFLFLALAAGTLYPNVAIAQAEGSCNTATGTIYGPNGTNSGIPCPGTTLSNDGIYGCRGLGAQVANVGTLSAIGGIYVPVNDAAVTLNTGFLVYKECILDGVTRKIAENISAEYTDQTLRAATTGRNGDAQFVRNEWAELWRQSDLITISSAGSANNSAMCSAFRNGVVATKVRNYMLQRNQPTAAYACTLPASGSFWSTLAALREPRNNPYGAYLIFDAQTNRILAANEFNQRERWLRSGGVYDAVDNLDDPIGGQIITPGYIIAQSIGQVVGSGFRQLETANEIDQVVGNLFGGLTTQLVADTRGLVGLTQPLNGQASYLDRMTEQTRSNVRQQATNAALAVIGAARQIELTYRQAKEGIATALTNAIQQLRGAEAQCWNLIIPAVQTYAQANGNPTLNIATSTQFSQQVIDSQIAPLATTTINDIRTSDAAITVLNQLIASVTNSASQANQQQALLRLDTMVANRQLHTAADATNAGTQRDSVVSAVSTLVTDTIKSWGDDTDPNVGWCNINNMAVVERWFNAWRQ